MVDVPRGPGQRLRSLRHLDPWHVRVYPAPATVLETLSGSPKAGNKRGPLGGTNIVAVEIKSFSTVSTWMARAAKWLLSSESS
jgi:hypothetical protein